MPPLELMLVRHGESEGNRDRMFTGHGPSPLTPRGLRQAEAVGQALSSPRPDAVYVSDLVRARATAEPLCRRAAIVPVFTARIRERDMGDFVGVRFEEVQARDPEGWRAIVERHPDYRPPGGESHRDVFARVSTFLDELRGRHSGQRVVVVSHGVAIHHMLRHLLQTPETAVAFTTDNGCVHRLELRADGMARVLVLNDGRHLPGI
jgi:probable phosphoglycerate mutase